MALLIPITTQAVEPEIPATNMLAIGKKMMADGRFTGAQVEALDLYTAKT